MIPYPTREQRYFEEYAPTVPVELYGVDLEREERISIIRDEARFGRPHSAWAYARQFIIAHFEDEPDDGMFLSRMKYDPSCGASEERWLVLRDRQVKRQRAAFEDWKGHLRELRRARSEIYTLAAKAERRMTASEKMERAMFNKFIGEAA
jgi:hypothetical protein